MLQSTDIVYYNGQFICLTQTHEHLCQSAFEVVGIAYKKCPLVAELFLWLIDIVKLVFECDFGSQYTGSLKQVGIAN